MYTQHDFTTLEFLSNINVRREIEKAKDKLEQTHVAFKQLEEEMKEECSFLQPSLEPYFKSIANIEAYIRKAENLLKDWDSTYYTKQASKRREMIKNRGEQIKSNIAQVKRIKIDL